MDPVLDMRPAIQVGPVVVRLVPEDFDGAYDDIPVKAIAAA